jgi:hypothetical protein
MPRQGLGHLARWLLAIQRRMIRPRSDIPLTSLDRRRVYPLEGILHEFTPLNLYLRRILPTNAWLWTRGLPAQYTATAQSFNGAAPPWKH